MSELDARLVERVRALLATPRPWSVTQVGDPMLRRTAVPYQGQLGDALLGELLDAMRAHLPGVGVGLAATQIGIPLALAVIEDPAEVPPEISEARERTPQPLLELVNPAVTPLGQERRAFFEGCLSVAGLTAVVSRAHRVQLSAQDRHGHDYELELSGWPARIAQHETDHLNGVLYLDRAEPRSLSTLAAYEQHWRQPTPDLVSQRERAGDHIDHPQRRSRLATGTSRSLLALSPQGPEKGEYSMPDLLPLSPDDLLTTTRAVRRRLDLLRPVPLDVIRDALEVALQAPSGGNRQRWHWVVVTDPAVKAQVADYYRRSHLAYSAARQASTPAAARIASSSDYLRDVLADVPVLVIAAIQADEGELPAGNQAGLWGSLLPAAWSFALALRARGLGTTWTTLHLNYEREIAELLGIPADVHQGVLLPVAYTQGTDFRPGPRIDVDSVLHINHW